MQTLFIGQHLIFLHEVDSTNTYATNLLRNVNIAEGAIISTNNQMQGKGQRGAVWNSEIGSNITVSCVLKPHFLSINNTFYLSKISALAIYDVLTELLPNSQFDIKIKWPNDILVNQKKIAGILIENNFNGDIIQHSVIGIGINVNQMEFKDLQYTASSLKTLTNQAFNNHDILEKLCQHLEKWYLKLKALKFSEIDEHYLNRLFGINQLCLFSDITNNEFNATIIGIDPTGKLILQHSDGELYYYEVKEVKLVY
jgi:BirA family biotin operon repressor/biotin-[acetyl-CoA-carboxylase] ligase